MAGIASGDSGDGGEAADVVEAARAARVASARADFIASLGRRTTELRTSLLAIEQEPTSPRARDVLRRRVHALTSGARLLRFGAMAAALSDAESLLDEAARTGVVPGECLQALAHIIDRLPSLAWGEPKSERMRTEPPAAPSAPIGEAQIVAPVVLLVGPKGFADAIAETVDRREAAPLECERCDLNAALEKARSLSPDVIVLDADLRDASNLLQQLHVDPLVEMPVIAVGSWSSPEQAASWLGAGASRALAKPVSPATLRTACRELATTPKPYSTYAPLGNVTIDELAARLADEVRRGLSEGVVPSAKGNRISLGPGAEVLAAVWAAVARVREIVTIKTEGEVRFSASGPEGALPLALWWNRDPAVGDRHAGVSTSRGEPESLLDGYSVVVADDDPGVAWFLASVLRAAGATVYEAHDGDRALALCIGRVPDLVISDVLMPGLDGFALCRALKRDIALRDVPVILLSWKEDLLQRLRELGATADGYLRKEASAAVVLQRVTEVLRPRMRIEARLRIQGEVRGRLDGITPRLLLGIVARLRPDARVCIHDASFLYEVELRAGAPKNATRTTSEGIFQRGPDIFGAMLGARAGRFSVTVADGPVRCTLTGSLREQLAFPVARARAAARLLGGTRLLDVHRVLVDIEGVLPYLAATPESARNIVERLANGDSPRSMILGGEVAPAALEEVLCDLAAHGAIRGVHGPSNLDLLEAAVRQELATLDELEASARAASSRAPGAAPRVTVAASPGMSSAPVEAVVRLDSPSLEEAQAAAQGSMPASPGSSPAPAGPAASTGSSTGSSRSPATSSAEGAKHGEHDFDLLADDGDEANALPADRPLIAPSTRGKLVPASTSISDDDAAPSSLEAAVIRELSGPTPPPSSVGAKVPGSDRHGDAGLMQPLAARVPASSPQRSVQAASTLRPVLQLGVAESLATTLVARTMQEGAELLPSPRRPGTGESSSGVESPTLRRPESVEVDRSSLRPPDTDLTSLPPDAIVPGGETSEDRLAVEAPVFPTPAPSASNLRRPASAALESCLVEHSAMTDAPTLAEAGTPVMGSYDLGKAEAGTPVMGSYDLGKAEAGTPVVGSYDLGKAEAGTPVVGSYDLGKAEAGTPVVGSYDLDTAEAGTPILGSYEPVGSDAAAASGAVARGNDESGRPEPSTRSREIHGPGQLEPGAAGTGRTQPATEHGATRALGSSPAIQVDPPDSGMPVLGTQVFAKRTAEMKEPRPLAADLGAHDEAGDHDGDHARSARDDSLRAPLGRADDGPILTVPPDRQESGWFLGTTAILIGVGLVAFAVRFGLQRLGTAVHLTGFTNTPALSASAAGPLGAVPDSTARTDLASPALPLAASSSPAPSESVRADAAPPRSWATTLTDGAADGSETPRSSSDAAGLSAPADRRTSAPSSSSGPVLASSAGMSGTEDTPVPQGVVLGADQGLLDVETVGKELIFVDGIELGRGPALRLPLSPGVHEVRLRFRDEDRVRFVLIRTGRRAHLSVKTPWSP